MNIRSDLDLFKIPPIQSNILSTDKVVYNPITSLDNSSSIEFQINANGDTYKRLSSMYLRLILQINTKTTDEANLPSVVNNIHHSIFRQCTVYMNNTQITQDTNFAYKSFLLTGKLTKKCVTMH